MENLGILTVTKHFSERFIERISKEETTLQQITDFLSNINYQFLTTAEYHDKKLSNFVLVSINNKNYVIVINETWQALITIFEADFGFSEEVNDLITKNTVKEAMELREKLEETTKQINDSKMAIITEIDGNNARIESLERELSFYRSKNTSLKNELDMKVLEVSSLKEQVNRILYKIIYSINYQFDKIGRK